MHESRWYIIRATTFSYVLGKAVVGELLLLTILMAIFIYDEVKVILGNINEEVDRKHSFE